MIKQLVMNELLIGINCKLVTPGYITGSVVLQQGAVQWQPASQLSILQGSRVAKMVAGPLVSQ